MGLPIVCFKGPQVDVSNYDVFLSLKFVLILANCADPDEMQHYAAFHLGLHCLQNYPFRKRKLTTIFNKHIHIQSFGMNITFILMHLLM